MCGCTWRIALRSIRPTPPNVPKENAPGQPGAFCCPKLPTGGGGLGGLLLDHLRAARLAAVDRDRARLHRLGHLAHQVDMQQAVIEAGALDLDMVGQAEAPLEGAPGDPVMQVAASFGVVLRLAGHRQRILVHGDVEFIARETVFATLKQGYAADMDEAAPAAK